MNVYDFDKTVFYPDSMILFAKYCIRRHPKLLFTYLPKLLKAAYLCSTGKYGETKLHAALNSITRYLKNPDRDIQAFWHKYERNLAPWYLMQKKSDDLIISASPEYLLEPIIQKLGIRMIATVVDKETGVMTGNVRLAQEKAKYIIEQNMPMIENFYSDALSDTPIALLAEHAFIVKGKAQYPEPWPHLNPDLAKVVKKKINVNKAPKRKSK